MDLCFKFVKTFEEKVTAGPGGNLQKDGVLDNPFAPGYRKKLIMILYLVV